MKFRIGNKVKVKESLILKLSSPKLIKTLKCVGTIIEIDSNGRFLRVRFPENKRYTMYRYDLELAKNQQLLFEFMK